MSVVQTNLEVTLNNNPDRNTKTQALGLGLRNHREKGSNPMTNLSVFTAGDTLGSARYVGTFENQSPEWHDQRATGIGGSDVSTIVGCNPWQSAYSLAAVRLGKIENNFTTSEAMEWGTRLEPVVLDKFAESHPELTVHREVGSWHHVDREWQLANPDALFTDEAGNMGIVEVKTARFEDDWKDGVPVYYRTQVQWYLQTFGFNTAIVVALFSGSKYREFTVPADDFEQDTNLAAVTEWKNIVDAGDLPDFSAPFISTLTTTREMHPEVDSDESVELGDLGVYYFLAEQDFKQAESHFTEMKARVTQEMGTAKRGLVNGDWVLTRQSRNGGTPYLVSKRG
jgi:putative phage-type endonuclease